MNKLNKICKYCSKEFRVRALSELQTRVYCSKICQVNSTKKNKVKLFCNHCNIEYFVNESISENSKFCSRKCKGLDKRKLSNPLLRQCNKCGLIKDINCFYKTKKLIEYRCKECQKERSKIRCRTIKGRFTIGKHEAKKRNLIWEINELQYEQLIIPNICHYCNNKLNESGCGLDRKNNKLGYLLENVVPCCDFCNTLKSNLLSYEEMMFLSENIKQILNKRN